DWGITKEEEVVESNIKSIKANIAINNARDRDFFAKLKSGVARTMMANGKSKTAIQVKILGEEKVGILQASFKDAGMTSKEITKLFMDWRELIDSGEKPQIMLKIEVNASKHPKPFLAKIKDDNLQRVAIITTKHADDSADWNCPVFLQTNITDCNSPLVNLVQCLVELEDGVEDRRSLSEDDIVKKATEAAKKQKATIEKRIVKRC
ncbi:hypothetical protein HDU76_008882, partial [Blyttiomyces sp. JEL0837]